MVLADHDNFGAVLGDNIAAAISGAVEYAQTPAVIESADKRDGGLRLRTCRRGRPIWRVINAQSGYFFTANMASSVTSTDSPPYPYFLGSGVIQRTYTVTDDCGVTNTAVQTITVSDTTPPVFTLVPTNVVYPADPGQCSKAHVTWMASAMDTCALASVISTLRAVRRSPTE